MKVDAYVEEEGSTRKGALGQALGAEDSNDFQKALISRLCTQHYLQCFSYTYGRNLYLTQGGISARLASQLITHKEIRNGSVGQ